MCPTRSEQILKFHGIYAQDNRDVRRERAVKGEALDYIFMIRVAIPGGRLTTDQWLALDDAATDVADGTIRLTTRQAVQFHGVLKDGLRPLARKVDAHLMTSFGACGDVVRNVVSCPELQGNDADERLREISRHLTRSFRATTDAHWEIFVNGDKAVSREDVAERPFYGETYLPRKFKIAVAHPNENCVDVLAQDVGLIPGVHPEAGEGFTLLVGGGLGRAYANPDTFARLADPMTFVTYDEVEEVIAAVLVTYRELGRPYRPQTRAHEVRRGRHGLRTVPQGDRGPDWAENCANRWRCRRTSTPTTIWVGDDAPTGRTRSAYASRPVGSATTRRRSCARRCDSSPSVTR